jgi:hypothetical protein
MVHPRAENTVNDVALSYQDALGDRLEAIYLFGSLVEGLYEPTVSDINLLVIIGSSTNIELYDEEIRPIWQLYHKTLRTNPIVASPVPLNRHLALNPLFASHLRRVGQRIIGEDYVWPEPNVDILEHMARLAKQAIECSALLGPTLLLAQDKHVAHNRLRQIHKQIFGLNKVESQSDNDRINQILLFANDRLADFPGLLKPNLFAEGAPPLISRLLSIYEAENRIYLVFPDIPSSEFKEILGNLDWSTVADRVAGFYKELRVTTAAQLRLILCYNHSADFKLKTFSHVWGVDILDDLDVADWTIYREQARLSSELLLIDLPSNYIYTKRSDLAMLVHDYQNKLLNIQLKHELLCRIMSRKLEFPEQKLPSRGAPIEVRLQGIFDHLEWWADYYFNKMNQSCIEEV